MKAVILDYLELCKPRVVALMVMTAVIAMILATPNGVVSWHVLLYGALGITFASSAGAIINHLIDRRIDALMARTKGRPIPSGRVDPKTAWLLAGILTAASMFVLVAMVNTTAALLSFASLIGYAGIYTIFLKRATPQNIVIGGLAGAMPPLLGWSAVTGHIDGYSLILVAIIFTWTPPHFWALAIARYKEYERANIPMLPVTHGLQYTRLNILLYTILMVGVTYLPYITNMSGLLYLIGVSGLNVGFLRQAIRLYRTKNPHHALATFHYSIIYLAGLFAVLLLDHFFSLIP